MKKRNRVLGALSAVVFGTLVLTFLVAFFTYFGKNLQFGITFIDAIKRLEIVFNLKQTEMYIVTQFAVLGLFLVGAVWALVWLILGVFKKHLIEILFFVGTCAAFFFFGLVMMYHGEALLRNICEPIGGVVDGNTVGKLIVLPIILVLILAGMIVTFAYDMKRIFSKDEPMIIIEPEEYSQEALFGEVFSEEKEAQEAANKKLVNEVMQKVDARIREEELLANMPLNEEDIPAVLREPEVDEEVLYERPAILDAPVEEEKEEPIEHLPFLDKPMPEEEEEKEEPIEHLPFLDKPMPEEEEEKEEPIEHLPFLDKPMPEEPKEEEYVYEHLPVLDRPEEEEKVEIPDFMKTESELAEVESTTVKKTVHHSSKAFHISKTDKGYQVKAAGSQVVEGTYQSEEEAVSAIRLTSPDASIRVHDKNGKIRSL